MSSEDDLNGPDAQGLSQEAKKRRVQRACDICRRKKSDGAAMPRNRCSNCLAYNLDCTYIEAAKKRGPPKGYVEGLETRLEKMEKLLQRLCPDADFTQELGNDVPDRRNSSRNGSGIANEASLSDPNSPHAVIQQRSSCRSSIQMLHGQDIEPSDDEGVTHPRLTNEMMRLSLTPKHDMRFHGKSSDAMLIRAAFDLKKEHSGCETNSRREHYWRSYPWERLPEEEHSFFTFPPDDLMALLIDLYFQHVNLYYPILHRPSFERAISDKRHSSDNGFGCVVLLVCALASRWCDDPRVFIEDAADDIELGLSSGWKYYDQVQTRRKSLRSQPRLYDLQLCALSSIYLIGTSTPPASWLTVGVGIRMAQDIGAHRKKVYSSGVSVESELWKRAFWVLVAMDRSGSAALGRPCAIQDEDFDLDFPLEVDDEYWENEDPEKAFKQPPDVPSTMSYFISYLKLSQIKSLTLRTIYAINKSKILLGFVGQKWEQHIVAELDSALNNWIDTVPDHLRWDPHRENLNHFRQSANLYATYYHLQILIHRPFIPTPRKPSPLTFPSLAICTNAARSCSHVADAVRQRGSEPLPHLLVQVFSAGIVLLLNVWGSKKAGGVNMDLNKQMVDVQKCMDCVASAESRWQTAGKLWDLLQELATVSDLPEPFNNKRERDAESPGSDSGYIGPSTGYQQNYQNTSITELSHRPMAGRKSLGTTSSGSPIPSSTAPSPSQQHLLTPNLQVAGGPDSLGIVLTDLQPTGVPTFNPSPNQPSPHNSYMAASPLGMGPGHEHAAASPSANSMHSGAVTSPGGLSLFEFLQTDPTVINFPLSEGDNFLPATTHGAQSGTMRNMTAYSLSSGGHGHGVGTPQPSHSPAQQQQAQTMSQSGGFGPAQDQNYMIDGLDVMHMPFNMNHEWNAYLYQTTGMAADGRPGNTSHHGSFAGGSN